MEISSLTSDEIISLSTNDETTLLASTILETSLVDSILELSIIDDEIILLDCTILEISLVNSTLELSTSEETSLLKISKDEISLSSILLISAGVDSTKDSTLVVVILLLDIVETDRLNINVDNDVDDITLEVVSTSDEVTILEVTSISDEDTMLEDSSISDEVKILEGSSISDEVIILEIRLELSIELVTSKVENNIEKLKVHGS